MRLMFWNLRILTTLNTIADLFMKIEKKGRLNLLIAGVVCLALGLVGWRSYAHRALNPPDYISHYADNRAALSDTKQNNKKTIFFIGILFIKLG